MTGSSTQPGSVRDRIRAALSVGEWRCDVLELRCGRTDEASGSGRKAVCLLSSSAHRCIAAAKHGECARGTEVMRRLNHWLAAGCALVSLGMLASCGRLSQRDVQPHIEAPFPRTLSAWHLFTSHSPALQPNRGVIPYDLNTRCFPTTAISSDLYGCRQGRRRHTPMTGPSSFPSAPFWRRRLLSQ
jgi:hypothetical protein